ncbi:MAG TPA: PHP domain-containing protein, partial [Polyangiaceae bacterium]|nr:PHP domain-containing protein [Polyangiaceae bacterium]
VAPALSAVSELRNVLRTEPARGVAHLSDRVTLRVHASEAQAWGNALFAWTGDAAHVTAVEQRARERGASLSEAAFADEPALYARAGLPWVPPELRRAELALESLETPGATELLETSDLRGLVHCHTTFSDGRNSVLEMARAAEALGMQYLTITDHSPAAQYARGVSVDELRRQWDEIAAAQEQVSVRLLRGVESDILREGELDYPDAVLEQLDVIIASIHSRHRLGREDMTRRIQRALGLPLFKIWGHGLGRILNHREPIDCDVPAILDTLAQSRGAIELNADPHRLDLPPAWIPAAKARGIPFVVSVDAHSTQGFGVLRYGVTMARRGGLRAAHVLNTLPANEFAARVKPIGG